MQRRTHKLNLKAISLAGLLPASLVFSCNQSSFQGSTGSKRTAVNKEEKTGPSDEEKSEKKTSTAKKSAQDTATQGSPGPTDIDLGSVSKTYNKDDADAPIRVFEPTTQASTNVQELQPQADKFAWTVTQTGTVTLHKIANKTVTSQKKWLGATPTNGGGARTYVIEGGGLVIGRTGGEMFFIDPAMAEGTNLRTLGEPYFVSLATSKALLDAGKPIATGERVCVVSYRRDEKRYLGLGWGAGNFAEVPQQDTSPFAPQWQDLKYKGSAGPGLWGYSCFIDQTKLIYYGRYVGDSNIQAFDIKNAVAATPNLVATNGLFTSNNLSDLTIGPKNSLIGSYAISGDQKGNVYNGNMTYTMSHDPVNRLVWQTSSNARSITVLPADCLSTQAVCSGQQTFPLTGNIGPISALGDGTLVGVTRYAPVSFLYLLELVDPKDLSKGLSPPISLAQLDGDPYMYTDYTGATLYLTLSEQTISLTKGGYKPELPLKSIGFTWATKDGNPAPWLDISLGARCYLSTDPKDKPDYEIVPGPIAPATQQTLFATATCGAGAKNIDTIDIRLLQLKGATSLMNVRKIQITGYQ